MVWQLKATSHYLKQCWLKSLTHIHVIRQSWPGRSNIHMMFISQYIDGLVQESRNSSALALELRLSCINPPMLDPDQSGRYFKNFFPMHLFKWFFVHFYPNYISVYYWRSNWGYFSIGSSDGLELNRWQAVTGTSDDIIVRNILSSGCNELITKP